MQPKDFDLVIPRCGLVSKLSCIVLSLIVLCQLYYAMDIMYA